MTYLVTVDVLGTLRVHVGGEEVALAGNRQRLALAALVLAGPQGSSVEQLAQMVWDEDPPDDHVGQLRTTVSRLRHRLRGDADDNPIATRPGGYRLDADVVDVDAWRFRAAFDAASASVERASMLAAALAWWRGDPFADVAGLGDLPDVTRLKAMRLDAEEEILSHLLSDGQLDHVVARSSDLLDDNPYRERLREMQVEALARSGRAADALAELTGHRQRLAAELGLDPSPRLDDLQQRILNQDSSLAAGTSGEDRLRGYRLGAVVARGPQFVVHAAIQPVLERPVELTTLTGAFAKDPASARRLDTFVQLAGRVVHPGLAPLVDAWRDAGRVHVVERSVGVSLQDHLQAHPHLARSVAAELIVRLCGAVYTLHQHGLAHGDVRSHVRVDGDGTPVLTGLTRTWALRQRTADREAHLSDVGLQPEDVRQVANLGLAVLAGTAAGGQSTDLHRALRAAAERPTAATLAAVIRNLQPAADVGRVAVGPNPYRGLAPLTAVDADVFAGRSTLVKEIADELVDGRPLVVLTGPSGVGKSSVIRAGVLPALLDASATDTQPAVVMMTPGRDPAASLREALNAVAVRDSLAAGRVLGEADLHWGSMIHEVVGDDVDVVLVVDQLEELPFAAGGDDAGLPDPTADHFLRILVEAVDHDRTSVLATVRADQIGRFLEHPEFGTRARHAMWAVGPLTPDGVKEAILLPAGRAGVDVEPAVIADVLSEMAASPTATPLLQLAMSRLFNRRDGRVLTAAAYRSLGGLAGSLVGHAEGVVAERSAAQVEAIRRLFAALVTLTGAGEPRRRQAALDEIADSVPLEIIEAAADARLVTIGQDPATREPVIELTHEALLSAWPRLADWIDQDREILRQRAALLTAADTWEREMRPEERLLRGGPLDVARRLQEDGQASLPGHAVDFVARSIAQDDQRREAEARQRRRERRLLRVLGFAVVVTLFAGGVAVLQRRAAVDNARAVEAAALVQASRNLVGEDPSLALQLAVQAVRRSDTLPTRAALLETLRAQPRLVATLEPIPMGGCPGLVAADDEVVVSWIDSSPLAQGSAVYVRKVLDPDVVGSDPDPSQWSRPVDRADSCVLPSPSGDAVLVDAGGQIGLLRANEPQGRWRDATPLAVAWTLDAAAIVAVSDDGGRSTVAYHDPRTLAVIREMQVDAAYPEQVVAASLHGPMLLLARSQDVPLVFDSAGRAQRLEARGERVRSAGMTADGRVVGATDQAVMAWNRDGALLTRVPLVGDGARDVQVDDVGQWVTVTTSAGVEVVDLAEASLVGAPIGIPGAISRFVGDDRVVVVGADGRALLMDVEPGEPLADRLDALAQVGVIGSDRRTMALRVGTRWTVTVGADVHTFTGSGIVAGPLSSGVVGVLDAAAREFTVVSANGRVSSVRLTEVLRDQPVVNRLVADPLVAGRGWLQVGHGLVVTVLAGTVDQEHPYDTVIVLEAGNAQLKAAIDVPSSSQTPVIAVPVASDRLALATRDADPWISDLDGALIESLGSFPSPVTAMAGTLRDGLLIGLANGSIHEWHGRQERWQLADIPVTGEDPVQSLAVVDNQHAGALHASGRIVLLDRLARQVEGELAGPALPGGPLVVADEGASFLTLRSGFGVEVQLSAPDLIRLACDRAGTSLDAEEWRQATGLPPPAQPPCAVGE